ncbi:hypothetical protein [Tepidibacter mesophilus]|uniref:hypothetical protein n=1 Tax=Tepidibacter mesophilus TaxID=655607 RepID=UPI000C077DD6|nr:hypothetical protein [Tepidibacter mesophilus]
MKINKKIKVKYIVLLILMVSIVFLADYTQFNKKINNFINDNYTYEPISKSDFFKLEKFDVQLFDVDNKNLNDSIFNRNLEYSISISNKKNQKLKDFELTAKLDKQMYSYVSLTGNLANIHTSYINKKPTEINISYKMNCLNEDNLNEKDLNIFENNYKKVYIDCKFNYKNKTYVKHYLVQDIAHDKIIKNKCLKFILNISSLIFFICFIFSIYFIIRTRTICFLINSLIIIELLCFINIIIFI